MTREAAPEPGAGGCSNAAWLPYAAALPPYAAAFPPYVAALPPYAGALPPYTGALEPAPPATSSAMNGKGGGLTPAYMHVWVSFKYVSSSSSWFLLAFDHATRDLQLKPA